MPPSKPAKPQKSIHQVIYDLGLYPAEAFDFVQQGLSFTVQKIHGQTKKEDMLCRHVSGTDLCEGLRELALHRWGMLARTVLDEYTYLDPKGNLFKLNTRRIVDSRPLPVSIMPDGLADLLTDRELRDLIAYLCSRR